jgi:hypothetical protein
MNYFGRMIEVKKNLYDEMQTQKRNEIGNQTLSLIIILLMLDTFSYNLGYQWIKYPNNIFFIVILCSGIYLIRSALNGALIAPKQNITKSTTNTVLIMVLSMISVTLLVKFIEPKQSNIITGDSNEILTIISIISVLIISATVIIYLVKHFKEKKLDD